MSTGTTLWPFASTAAMPEDQWQQWFDLVYLSSDVDALLADPARSIVVVTNAGCGLTTSLARLPTYSLLTFRYDPERWPGQPQAFTAAPDHFGQWMAYVADALTTKLRNQRELVTELTDADHVFLIWLLRRYLGRRQSDVWVQHLPSLMPADRWQSLHREVSQLDHELYDNSVSALYGQIDECLGIARLLGWDGIFAGIDLSWPDWITRTPEERAKLTAGIRQLLTTLTPLERRGFGIKLGLPRHAFSPREVRELIRDRAFVTSYNWTLNDVAEITRRLLSAATDGAMAADQLLTPHVWQAIAADINSIWGAPGPAAAAAVAHCALQFIHDTAWQDSFVTPFRRMLYRSSALLRLDRDTALRRVWRGMTAITFDETPFRFFELLWKYKGDLVDNEILKDIAGSKANLDKNISRIRKAIEPFYEDRFFMYVQRRTSSGTWIDKSLCLFTT